MSSSRIALSAGLVDQALVGVGSLAVLVVGGRVLAAAGVGALATGVTTAQTCVVVARAFGGEALIASALDQVEDRAEDARHLFQFCLAAGLLCVVAGGPLLLGGGALEQSIGWALVAAPGLMVQDSARYLFFRRRQAVRALWLDAAVVPAQLALILVAGWWLADFRACLVAWALPAWVWLLVVIARDRKILDVRGAQAWRRRHGASGSAFAYEAVLGGVVQWVTLWAVIRSASLAQAGAFRGVITILGLTNIVLAYLRSSVLAHIVNQGKLTSSRAVVAASLMSGFSLLAVGVAWGVLALLPSQVGALLLGSVWLAASPLLLVGAVSRLAAALATVPGVLLRAAGVTWSAARVRTAVAVVTLTLGPLGAHLGGARGAFWGLAAASSVMCLSLTWLLVAKLRADSGESRRSSDLALHS